MKQIGTLALLLLLSACGFKLRGMANFPPWFTSLAIVGSNTSHDLTQSLQSRLESYKISVLRNSDAAPYWIVIQDESSKQQITAVSSTTIPRQYQLTYKVRYELIHAKGGKPIIPSTAVTATRQLTVNNDRILGSDNEEALLYDEMHDEAALLIISQLSHQLSRITP